MAIALLAKLRSLHTAAIHAISVNGNTLTRIIAVSSHTYVSRTISLESMKAALTYLRYLKTKLP